MHTALCVPINESRWGSPPRPEVVRKKDLCRNPRQIGEFLACRWLVIAAEGGRGRAAEGERGEILSPVYI